jgi:hypothetical protein
LAETVAEHPRANIESKNNPPFQAILEVSKMVAIAVTTACDATPNSANRIARELNSQSSTAPKFLRLMRHTDSGEYLQAPVVVADDDHWSGFRPDRIKALVNQVQAAS